MTINWLDYAIAHIQTENVVLDRLGFYRSPIQDDDYLEIKILLVKEYLRHYLYTYRPIYVCSESPFFLRSKPKAYGILERLVSFLRMTVREYDSTIPFITYSPSEVKIGVGAGHIAGKDEVKETILSIPEITEHVDQIAYCSEHELDAIAVCYTLINNIKAGKELCPV